MKLFSLFFLITGFSSTLFGQSNYTSWDFEEPCSILMPLQDSGAWQIGTVTTPFFAGIRPGNRAIVTDTSGMYGINRHDSFELHFNNGPFIVEFTFYHIYDTDSLADGGYIEVSYDEGSTWRDIGQPDSNYIPEIDVFIQSSKGGNSPLSNGKKGFSGNSEDTVVTIIRWIWHLPMKITPDSTFLRFHFISDPIPDNKEGWMIYKMNLFYPDVWGMSDKSVDLGIRFYPNPSSGVYHVDLGTLQDKPYSLQIYDLQGRVIVDRPLSSKTISEIDLRQYSGRYFFYRILTDDGRVQTGKLVKTL